IGRTFFSPPAVRRFQTERVCHSKIETDRRGQLSKSGSAATADPVAWEREPTPRGQRSVSTHAGRAAVRPHFFLRAAFQEKDVPVRHVRCSISQLLRRHTPESACTHWKAASPPKYLPYPLPSYAR